MVILCFVRARIEKEKKKVAQEAGFLRTEVLGGEVRKGNLAWNFYLVLATLSSLFFQTF